MGSQTARGTAGRELALAAMGYVVDSPYALLKCPPPTEPLQPPRINTTIRGARASHGAAPPAFRPHAAPARSRRAFCWTVLHVAVFPKNLMGCAQHLGDVRMQSRHKRPEMHKKR